MRSLILAALLFFIPLSAALAQVAPIPIPASIGGGGGFTFSRTGGSWSLGDESVWPNPMSTAFSYVSGNSTCFADGVFDIEVVGNAIDVTVTVTSVSATAGYCGASLYFTFDLVSAIQTNGESVAMIYADPVAVTHAAPSGGPDDYVRFTLYQVGTEIETVFRGMVQDIPFRPVEVIWEADEPVAIARRVGQGGATGVYGFAQPGDAFTTPMHLDLVLTSWTTGVYSARFELLPVAPQPVSSISPGLGLPLGAVALLGLASLKG